MPFALKLSRTKRPFREADVLVFSIAKSGRTWLRLLVNKYISLRHGIPLDLEDMGRDRADVPSIVYTHEIWNHITLATPKQYFTGKYLLTDGLVRKKKVLFLYRDPRDTVISLFFEATKRNRKTRDRLDLNIGEFIRDPRFGIESVIDVMNRWDRRFSDHPHAARLSYEDLHADTESELARALDFMGFAPHDPALVKEAVEFARFENMKRMEKNNVFDHHKLRAVDPSDPDSYKVREGKVGGHVKHLEGGDLAYVNAALSKLAPSFPYKSDTAA
jgi:hypothetical protein